MEQLARYGIKKDGALCNGNHGRGYNVKLFQEVGEEISYYW